MSEVNFAAMTDEQLDVVLADLKPKANKYQEAASEKNRRNIATQDMVDEEEREKLKSSGKVKKLAVRFKKAVERIRACGKTKELVVTLPVTFTLTSDVYDDFDEYDHCCEREFSSVFGMNAVEAKIGQATGINRAQKALLQQGLDTVVENACEEIYGLFPAQTAEQEKALAELNAVLSDASEHDLTFADLA